MFPLKHHPMVGTVLGRAGGLAELQGPRAWKGVLKDELTVAWWSGRAADRGGA